MCVDPPPIIGSQETESELPAPATPIVEVPSNLQSPLAVYKNGDVGSSNRGIPSSPTSNCSELLTPVHLSPAQPASDSSAATSSGQPETTAGPFPGGGVVNLSLRIRYVELDLS